jgi:hypothetical protein
MMNLMEYKPESILVPQHVPPIKEKCSNEPPDEAFRERHVPGGQMENRDVKDPNPKPRGGQSNSELYEIYQQRTPVPAFRLGEVTPRKHSLQD